MKELTRQEELENIGNWLMNGDTGMSSIDMCGTYLGGTTKNLCYPNDPSDFNRCMKFLDCIDAGRRMDLLFTMANKSTKWSAIVGNWDTLVALWEEECVGERWNATKLYNKMNELNL